MRDAVLSGDEGMQGVTNRERNHCYGGRWSGVWQTCLPLSLGTTLNVI